MSQPMNIILVDDDQDACELVKMQLEETGRFAVHYTTDGAAAVPLALEKNADLIILDINMPGKHGVEVASLLEANPLTSVIPILYLSGMVSPEEVARFAGEEDDRTLISKGSPLSELIETIDRVVSD